MCLATQQKIPTEVLEKIEKLKLEINSVTKTATDSAQKSVYKLIKNVSSWPSIKIASRSRKVIDLKRKNKVTRITETTRIKGVIVGGGDSNNPIVILMPRGVYIAKNTGGYMKQDEKFSPSGRTHAAMPFRPHKLADASTIEKHMPALTRVIIKLLSPFPQDRK